MKNVLITGAGGFVGRHLVTSLADKEYYLRLGLRGNDTSWLPDKNIERVEYDVGITAPDYAKLLQDIDVVIHLAGIAHRKSVHAADYKKVNIEGTANLANAAAAEGVKRFIFLSTVKVHGESSSQVFSETTSACPQDNYSQSKLEAEASVIRACENSSMDYVILRPPLVFGPRVKANFLTLLRIVARQWPLPFASIDNRRSLIYVENLCDLIWFCVDSPLVKNQTFLLKDSDYSTPGLVRQLAQALGKTPRLLPFPPAMLKLAGKLLNRSAQAGSIVDSLYVDDSKLSKTLGWTPPVGAVTAMQRTADWFYAEMNPPGISE